MNPKKIAFFLGKLVVSGLSLYLVLRKVDTAQMFSMMRRIGALTFLAASCLYVLSLLGAAFRWKLLLPERFTLGRLFSLYLIGAFFSSFLPGVIGGDVVKAYYLNKDARKVSLTLASVFMDRYLGYVSLVLIGIIAFPFSLGYFGDSPYRLVMPVIFASFVVGSILFFGLQVGRRFRVVSEFYDYFTGLRGRLDIIAKTVAISCLIQVMGFVAVALLARAMGEHIPFLTLFVFLPIIITITTIPISISGLGLREGAFVVLLGLIGVRPEVATSLSLSWFFSTFIGSLPGLFAYMRHTGGSAEAS